MKNKRFLACMFGLMMLMFCLTGCKKEVTEDHEVVDEYAIVNTEYGDLYYQAEWEAEMITEERTSNDTITVAFKAKINDETYELFEVIIGGDEGTYIGDLTGPDGTVREVYAQMEEIPVYEELTEGEQNRLYGMQEDVNCVIEHLI